MARINLAAQHAPYTSNAPFGNYSVQSFKLKTNSIGAAIGADSVNPIAANDVIDLGPLQAGLRLEDSTTVVKTALAGSVQVGFAYEDGIDDPNVPQSAAYFNALIPLTSAVKVKANGTRLVTLPKNARLILTPSTAQTGAGEVEVLVYGEQTGLR
jgi:hypothetical protein